MLNLDELSAHRPVYAIDLLGFGKSSRPNFSDDPQTIEEQYVMFLEKWREMMGIPKMILLGHSLGGFITSSYAIRYPERVAHLILAGKIHLRNEIGYVNNEMFSFISSRSVGVSKLKFYSQSILPFYFHSFTAAPEPKQQTFVQRYIMQIFTKFPPFRMVRAAGPLAPKL